MKNIQVTRNSDSKTFYMSCFSNCKIQNIKLDHDLLNNDVFIVDVKDENGDEDILFANQKYSRLQDEAINARISFSGL